MFEIDVPDSIVEEPPPNVRNDSNDLCPYVNSNIGVDERELAFSYVITYPIKLRYSLLYSKKIFSIFQWDARMLHPE